MITNIANQVPMYQPLQPNSLAASYGLPQPTQVSRNKGNYVHTSPILQSRNIYNTQSPTYIPMSPPPINSVRQFTGVPSSVITIGQFDKNSFINNQIKNIGGAETRIGRSPVKTLSVPFTIVSRPTSSKRPQEVEIERQKMISQLNSISNNNSSTLQMTELRLLPGFSNSRVFSQQEVKSNITISDGQSKGSIKVECPDLLIASKELKKKLKQEIEISEVNSVISNITQLNKELLELKGKLEEAVQLRQNGMNSGISGSDSHFNMINSKNNIFQDNLMQVSSSSSSYQRRKGSYESNVSNKKEPLYFDNSAKKLLISPNKKHEQNQQQNELFKIKLDSVLERTEQLLNKHSDKKSQQILSQNVQDEQLKDVDAQLNARSSDKSVGDGSSNVPHVSEDPSKEITNENDEKGQLNKGEYGQSSEIRAIMDSVKRKRNLSNEITMNGNPNNDKIDDIASKHSKNQSHDNLGEISPKQHQGQQEQQQTATVSSIGSFPSQQQLNQNLMSKFLEVSPESFNKSPAVLGFQDNSKYGISLPIPQPSSSLSSFTPKASASASSANPQQQAQTLLTTQQPQSSIPSYQPLISKQFENTIPPTAQPNTDISAGNAQQTTALKANISIPTTFLQDNYMSALTTSPMIESSSSDAKQNKFTTPPPGNTVPTSSQASQLQMELVKRPDVQQMTLKMEPIIPETRKSDYLQTHHNNSGNQSNNNNNSAQSYTTIQSFTSPLSEKKFPSSPQTYQQPQQSTFPPLSSYTSDQSLVPLSSHDIPKISVNTFDAPNLPQTQKLLDVVGFIANLKSSMTPQNKSSQVLNVNNTNDRDDVRGSYHKSPEFLESNSPGFNTNQIKVKLSDHISSQIISPSQNDTIIDRSPSALYNPELKGDQQTQAPSDTQEKSNLSSLARNIEQSGVFSSTSSLPSSQSVVLQKITQQQTLGTKADKQDEESLPNEPEDRSQAAKKYLRQLKSSKSFFLPLYEEKNPFSYKLSNFQVGKKLGHGKFSDVFSAVDKETGFRVALKQIKKSTVKEYNLYEDILNEIKIQGSLSHPNIIQLYGFFIDQESVYLIQELACGKELFAEQKASVYKKFTENQASFFVKQIIEALIYMHQKQVVHRDIKPENIMVFNNLLKICDFGYATRVELNSMRKTFCGTLDYVSPEMVQGMEYDYSVDVWSLGILTYELIIGNAPFQGRNNDETFDEIVNGELRFSGPISFEAGDFITRILQRDPDKRMTLAECLQHPFIQEEYIRRLRNDKGGEIDFSDLQKL